MTAKFAQRKKKEKSLQLIGKKFTKPTNREMQYHKEKFSKDMIIVCQYFNTIYT